MGLTDTALYLEVKNQRDLLRTRVNAHESELNYFRRRVARLERDNALTLKANDAQGEICDTLSKELLAADAELLVRGTKISEAHATIGDFKKKLKAVDGSWLHSGSVPSSHSELESRYRAQVGIIADYQGRVSSRNEEIAQLCNELDDWKSGRKSTYRHETVDECVLATQRARIEDLQAKSIIQGGKLFDANTELIALRARVAESDFQYNHSPSYSELKAKYEALLAEVEGLRKNIGWLQDELGSVRWENGSAHAGRRAAEATLEKTIKEWNVVQSHHRTLVSRIRDVVDSEQ